MTGTKAKQASKQGRHQSMAGTYKCRSKPKTLAICCSMTAVVTILQPSSNDSTNRPCMQSSIYMHSVYVTQQSWLARAIKVMSSYQKL